MEVHQTPLQQLHVDIKVQDSAATTEKEPSGSDIVTTILFEDEEGRTVLVENSSQVQTEVTVTDIQQQQDGEDTLVSEINTDEKDVTEKDIFLKKKQALLKEGQTPEISSHKIEQSSVAE